jgi:flagellar hook-length control protein FliK
MSFPFQNISQSANLPSVKSDSGKLNSVVSNIEDKGSIDFDSILGDALNSSTISKDQNQDPIVLSSNLNRIHSFPATIKNENFSLSNNLLMTSNQAKPNPRVEIKDRATIDSQVLKFLLSNQKDTITIDVPNSTAMFLQSEPIANKPFTLDNNKYSDPDEMFTNVTSIADKQMAFPADSDNKHLSLTLKLSDLFSSQLDGQKPIPAAISDQSGLEKHGLVNATKLMSLLKDYPDPILVEISDINNIISAQCEAKSNLLPSAEKTSFSFDLRDLVKVPEQNSKTQINGVLKSVEKPSISTAVIEVKPSENAAKLWVEFPEPNNDLTSGHLDILAQSKSILVDKADTRNSEPDSNNDTTKQASSEGNETVNPAKPKECVQSDRTPMAEKANPDNIISIPDKIVIKNDSIPRPTADLQSRTEMMTARIEDIKSAIAAAIEKQMSSVKIRLQPESLGSVNVKITWKNNDLSVGLITENKDTATLLNSNLAELKVGLENANLKIRDINVTIDDSHQNGNSNSGQNHSGGSHNNARHEHRNTDIYESAYTAPFPQSLNRIETSGLSSIINSHGWIDLKA